MKQTYVRMVEALGGRYVELPDGTWSVNGLDDRAQSFFDEFLAGAFDLQADALEDLDELQEPIEWPTALIRAQIDMVLERGNCNCTIARSPDDKHGIFLIFEGWKDVSTFNYYYNLYFRTQAFIEWYPRYKRAFEHFNAGREPYLQRQTDKMFEDMRLGTDKNSGQPYMWFPLDDAASSPYQLPDGLCDLSDVVEYGFSDEWSTCDRCNALIRTAPDCYGWQPDYAEFEWGERVCKDCLSKDDDMQRDYIEQHRNARRLLNRDLVDIAETKFGWDMVDVDYENGWYPGQNDDPRIVLKLLNAADIDCIFTGSVGQFDVNFNVWVPTDRLDEAESILKCTPAKLPYDPGTEMGKALRGESSVYQRVEQTITPEQFVDGSWAKEPVEGVRITKIDYGRE